MLLREVSRCDVGRGVVEVLAAVAAACCDEGLSMEALPTIRLKSFPLGLLVGVVSVGIDDD